VLTGDFVKKRGLQNLNPSRRMALNALQNTNLGNPKCLPTTEYKTKIIKNHQIRAVYKIDWKTIAPSKAWKCPKQGLWGMFRFVFCKESTLKYFGFGKAQLCFIDFISVFRRFYSSYYPLWWFWMDRVIQASTFLELGNPSFGESL